MLCLSGFELYSRWVPLSKEGTHTRKKTASMGMKGRGARETVGGQFVLLWRTVALDESLLSVCSPETHEGLKEETCSNFISSVVFVILFKMARGLGMFARRIGLSFGLRK